MDSRQLLLHRQCKFRMNRIFLGEGSVCRRPGCRIFTGLLGQASIWAVHFGEQKVAVLWVPFVFTCSANVFSSPSARLSTERADALHKGIIMCPPRNVSAVSSKASVLSIHPGCPWCLSAGAERHRGPTASQAVVQPGP